ncbi:MAG: VWA domain-containing protein, partial [Variovorax sp.]
SDMARLKHADFTALSAGEFHLVEGLARDIALPVPQVEMRRMRPGTRGNRLHWARSMRQASQTGGELMVLRRMQRSRQPLPLLVLVDVSGSMERYARLLLAFLHAATRRAGQRDVFAFGTHLTDLTPAFRIADTDAMLEAASAAIDDFAGGTRLGGSLTQLRRRHARRLVGRRTLVLVISDGLDTGEPAELEQELLWLKRHSRKLLWLNPLMRYEGYAPLARGAALLHRHADAMLAVHNLSALEELAASLATLMRAGR